MKAFLSHQKIQFLILFLFSIQAVHATDGWLATGVRSFSLGNIRAAGDEWLNPAVLSFIEKEQIELSVFNRFQMSELNTANLSFACPNKYLDAGFRLSTFGYADYRTMQLRGSFARKIKAGLSVGIQVDYRNLRSRWAEDSHDGLAAGFGIYYQLSKQVALALLGEDLLCTSSNEIWRWQAGLHYRISESITFILETAYDRQKTFRFAAGMDYTLLDQFHLRSGYDSDYGMPAFGAGYSWSRWQVDVAFSSHSVLGMSSILGVKYTF